MKELQVQESVQLKQEIPFSSYPVWKFLRNSGLPTELWQLPEPPSELYVQGSQKAIERLANLPDRGLAIVGTRSPQSRSIGMAVSAIETLKRDDFIIVSGFARGIDTVAHTTALKSGLTTIAILGTGLDSRYPISNLRLRGEILKAGGLIVSEFPLTAPGLPHQFLLRNRLIAAWSKATLVVEAGQRSGALSTARWARELHRDCFAVPSFPGDPAFMGNQILLDRDHASPFWGIHSLGITWLELATRSGPAAGLQTQLPFLPSSPDSEFLVQQIRLWTHQRGGIQLNEIQDWAISRGWSHLRFLKAFREAQVQRKVVDRMGVWGAI